MSTRPRPHAAATPGQADSHDDGPRGFLLTVDGPGGVGKSTTVAALADHLRAMGRAVHRTTEPSSSPLGVATRQLADQVRGEALALLVAADRRHHLTTEVGPHLQAGDVVVCDRYLPSSLVLQRLDGVNLDFILGINDGITVPDLAVILTAEAALISTRLQARGAHHRFEHDPGSGAVQRELDLYEEAITILRTLNVPVLRLDVGGLSPDQVAAQIWRVDEALSATVAVDHLPPTPDDLP